MSEHSTFDICVEPIELYKLLKIANLASGGSEAKTMIREGHVLVNKKVADQNRKKIRRGDIIEYKGKTIEVAFNPTKKSAEFINTVTLANQSLKKKKNAKSKARATSAATSAKPSTQA